MRSAAFAAVLFLVALLFSLDAIANSPLESRARSSSSGSVAMLGCLAFVLLARRP